MSRGRLVRHPPRRPLSAAALPGGGGAKKRRNSSPPTPPPPPPSSFPPWSYEPRPFFRFEVLHQSSRSMARVGRIHTPHGAVDTPSFVPVATNAALKGVDFRSTGPDRVPGHLVFANTYHLLLQPGSGVVRDAGGIHKFTGREDGPFITDSGGFQVFSLAYGSVREESGWGAGGEGGELKRARDRRSWGRPGWRTDVVGRDAVQVTEEGATFRSYRDGSRVLLTPESTVEAQKDIGADIIVPLDELPPYHIDRERLEESVERSHRWEARSLRTHLGDVREQAMYSVIHGGVDRELRTKSVEYLTSLPFDGHAIGGSLGSGREELAELLGWMMPLFDLTGSRRRKPRHLLGIGDEPSIRNAVPLGLDTFDSSYPTRLGRHGTLLTRRGLLRIKRGGNARAFGAKIDEECTCRTCQRYDRAYLCHLFKAREPLGIMLATEHNLQYMSDLMAELRTDILEDLL